MLHNEDLTQIIIAAAMEVHRHLGPGLLESVYEECMCRELTLGETPYARQVALPLEYKGIKLDCGYRMDLVVKDLVVVELKCVDKVLPIHEAQLLTYLKLSKIRTGLIINFNSPLLKDGVRRFVL
jgi:GxxExxY protein